MSLRLYDDLAQEAGLSSLTASIPADFPLANVLTSVVTNMANKALKRAMLIGFLIYYGFFFFLVFPSVMDSSIMVIFPLFCLGPVVVIGAVVGGYTLLMGTLVAEPQVKMSSVLLRRGDDLQIQYTQPIKRNVSLKSLSYSLILQESATYDQGTSTVTETHDHVIDQNMNFDVHLSSETGIEQTLAFKIPDDAMHTFEAPRNTLNWYLKVHFDVPNFPDYQKLYKIKVLAEVNDES